MSQDEARECVSAYIDKLKQHFGTNNSIIKVTLANIQIDQDRVKVVFNKEEGTFTPLFPELTEGKFKTDAQENRYVNFHFGLYLLTKEVHENPKFLTHTRMYLIIHSHLTLRKS